ncbi:hypothetical protein C1H46_003026 [Malus baccata]|uniref:Uncharacterized protein n=1 Tax=Malus baccata TaxID=106549 RepID=A0A540NJR2_MALBA|nr:hypothetical protein C1H46_003026 [Malus baccata]
MPQHQHPNRSWFSSSSLMGGKGIRFFKLLVVIFWNTNPFFIGFDDDAVIILASFPSFFLVMRPSQPPQATWSQHCCRPGEQFHSKIRPIFARVKELGEESDLVVLDLVRVHDPQKGCHGLSDHPQHAQFSRSAQRKGQEEGVGWLAPRGVVGLEKHGRRLGEARQERSRLEGSKRERR